MTKKTLHAMIVVLLLCTELAAQDFRVKKITITDYIDEDVKTTLILVDYANDMVRAINGSNLEVKKNKIACKGLDIGYYGGSYYNIELDKEGRVEKRGEHEVKFYKDGKVKEVEGTNISDQGEKKVFYDEFDRVRLLGKDPTEDRMVLLSYNDQNQAVKVEYGDTKEEPTTAEWKNGKLKAIYNYSNGYSLDVVRHEFYYNDYGDISEEKLYCKDSDKNDAKEYLAKHYQIEYEEGKGNDNIVFLDLNNPFTEILFGQKSFVYPRRMIY